MERWLDKKPQILIVDDEASARETLAALLFREGYDLAFTTSGLETLTRLNEFKPDVILLDVMMPGMDGFEVCQRLKTDECWRHIPTVLVTALDSKEDLARGLDAGADDFLSKPVNGLELRARMRSMLRIKKQHDDLEATLQLREDLADMIVHDMKTPLTSILGLSYLLLEGNGIAPNYLNDMITIRNQAQRLNSFINDMLIIAKVEQGKLILNCSIVDIHPLVLEVEKSHNVIAQSKRIKLVINLPVQSQQMSLDLNLFQRVLDNLISNALKFSPVGSTVTLQVEYPKMETKSQLPTPHVRIKVLDEGRGIAEEYRHHIFNKFEIVALKEKGVSQIGLGLAFCKMVVEAHGGHISVAANEPMGSLFTVEI